VFHENSYKTNYYVNTQLSSNAINAKECRLLNLILRNLQSKIVIEKWKVEGREPVQVE